MSNIYEEILRFFSRVDKITNISYSLSILEKSKGGHISMSTTAVRSKSDREKTNLNILQLKAALLRRSHLLPDWQKISTWQDPEYANDSSSFCCGGETISSLTKCLESLGLDVSIGGDDSGNFWYDNNRLEHMVTRAIWVDYPETEKEFHKSFLQSQKKTVAEATRWCQKKNGNLASQEEFFEFLLYTALRGFLKGQSPEQSVALLIPPNMEEISLFHSNKGFYGNVNWRVYTKISQDGSVKRIIFHSSDDFRGDRGFFCTIPNTDDSPYFL